MSDAGTSAKRKAGKSSSADQRASSKQSLTQALDTELYSNGNDKYAGYNTSLAVRDDDDDMEDAPELNGRRLVGQYTASKDILNEFAHGATEEADILTSREEQAQIRNRETDYQKRRFERFDRGADEGDMSYQDRMKVRDLDREEARVRKAIEEREKNGNEVLDHKPTLKDGESAPQVDGDKTPPMQKPARRKRRWDAAEEPAKTELTEETNGAVPETKKSRWETGSLKDVAMADAPADVAAQAPVRSRWDTTGAPPAGSTSAAPAAGEAPRAMPSFAFGTDISSRNAPLSDEQLDAMLPGESEGYRVLEPPEGYAPVRRPIGMPQLPAQPIGYMIPESGASDGLLGKQMPTEIPGVGDLAFFKNEDMKYFGKLVDGAQEDEMTVEELKERKIMRLLLKVKNGTPPMRKTALRQLTDNARQFGAGPLFNQILPLLMERTLEDQERHLLVKVIDRILYKLDDLVRPTTMPELRAARSSLTLVKRLVSPT